MGIWQVNITRLHANSELAEVANTGTADTTPLVGVLGSAKIVCVPTLQLGVGPEGTWRMIEGVVCLIGMPVPRLIFRPDSNGVSSAGLQSHVFAVAVSEIDDVLTLARIHDGASSPKGRRTNMSEQPEWCLNLELSMQLHSVEVSSASQVWQT